MILRQFKHDSVLQDLIVLQRRMVFLLGAGVFLTILSPIILGCFIAMQTNEIVTAIIGFLLLSGSALLLGHALCCSIQWNTIISELLDSRFEKVDVADAALYLKSILRQYWVFNRKSREKVALNKHYLRSHFLVEENLLRPFSEM